MIQDENLIFIISQPRSGSTLLQSVLSNNEWINTASEPWLLFHFLGYFNPHLIDAKYSNVQAYEATKDFLNKTNFQEGIKQEVRDFINKVYQKTLGQEERTKYILDKTPRYYEIIDSIRDVFPKAKIILLKRNPLATLSSIIDTWGVKGINGLYTSRRDILEAPFLLQKFVEKNSSDPNVLITNYETIVHNPQQEVGRIYQWLDIEFREKYLNYADNPKFKGMYGDPTGIQQATTPIKKNENWHEKLKDSYWQKFFLGYIDYLSNSFLQSYGYGNTELAGKETDLFNTFHFIADKNIPDQPPTDSHFRYLRYRGAYRLYAR